MADENIVTNIVANADFSNLIGDVHKVTTSLSKLQQQIANSNKMLANQISVMNKSFSDTLRSTGQFSTHFVSLQSDVEKFGKNLDGGKLKLNQYFQTLQTHAKTSGGLIRDLAKQQVALQNSILQPLGKNAQGLMQFNVHVPRGLDEIKNKSAIARQELQIMNKVIQEGAGQLINWGKNTQWAGRQLTVGLSVPLAAFGKAAADAFRQADAELVRLIKVYGDISGTSAAELSKVREDVVNTAKEISKAYGVSFKDTISLAADIAATGKQGNDLLNSVKETSRLAVLGEVDRQDAMKATLAIQTAFKQNTEQLSESINFLNAVENQTSTTLGDLIEAIPKAGPVVQGLGGSVKDLALYLTAMKEGGINAAEGANAIKSSLASLINPTSVATDKFKSFGIDLLGIVQSNAGNVTGTLLELQKALDTLNPLQKQQAIEQLFGKFQFARMNALFENLGKQGSQTLKVLDLMKASSQDLATVAGRELNQVTESASGKYRRALEGLKADLAGVGEQFLSINTSLINIVDNVLKFVNNLPKPLKQALSFIGGLTAVAGPLIMLTGVLANFFGYILKGIGHMKSFFRGGEGWKYLTPEILASEKAGKLIEQTFYSDAKAAGVLQMALRNLIDEFSVLEAKAKAGSISVAPGINTMAGNLVVAAGAGGRQVNPAHPLLTATDTRSMSHMNPVAGMSSEQKLAQTMFGVVPGAPRVNNKIKDNPQIYSAGDLPNISGLTRIGGVSTGVVAEEAAKWHSMTGALGMQSEAELDQLKREVAATGTITSSLSDSYQALLPQMSHLTQLAATESAAIVAELQAGKLTVDQAKAKIIELNYQIEAMMGQAATSTAAGMGRSINLTQLPLVNQPVVDPSGKSNMKEITRPGRTRELLNKIARGLGVKTYGAPYSIETTIPKRFATGGAVGGSGNQDTVPAMLTPGEFVVNKQATAANLPLLMAMNGGAGGNTLGRNAGGFMAATMFWQSGGINGLLAHPDQTNRRATFGLGEGNTIPGSLLADDMLNVRAKGLHPGALLYDIGTRLGYSKKELIPAIQNMDKEMQQILRKSGNLTVDEYNTIAELSLSKNLSKVKRHSPKLNRRVGFYEELKKIGFSRNAGNKGRQAGSERLIGFDGQKIPVPLATTGGGLPAGMATAHYSMQQDLLDPSERISRTFGSGENTITRALGVQRGHAGNIGVNPISPRSLSPFADASHGRLTSLRNPLMRIANGWRNPIAVASDPVRDALKFRWGTSAAFSSRAGRLRLNEGGIVPGIQYLNEGSDGPVQPAKVRFSSAYQSQRAKGFVGSGMMSSGPMAGMGIGMGMQMAGGMMGGQLGTMLQLASVLPMMAPNMISGIPGMLSKVSGGLKGVGGMAGLAGKAMGLAFRVGPLLAVTTAIAGAIAIFKKFKSEQEQNRIEQANTIGITKKSAAEAGIKYNNLAESIKAVNQQLELTRAKSKNAYESLNSSGVQGLTLSIKELKQNIKDAKSNQKELVATFNNIDNSNQADKQAKVNEVATNLKAQFVAAGMTAQEATNKIYSIIAASDKAGMAFNAISGKGFREVVDASTAADAMINKLNSSMANVSGESLGNSLSNITAALDINLAKLMKTKKANGEMLTEQEAMSQILDQINKKKGSEATLTESQVQSLKKTHPELADILNSTDNIAGVYAKWRVLLSGVRVDLKKISSEQAQTIAAFEAQIDSAIAKSELVVGKGTGIMSSSQKAIAALQKQIAAGGNKAAVAAQKTQDQINAEIKLIDKRIDKINEEADARKKALEAQQSKENLALEIQKTQMEYADKMAAGDMAGAAQAQLKIKQLIGEREAQKAIDAIEENRAKREKELIAQKEKLQAQSDKAAKSLTAAQNNAAASTTRMNKIDQYQNEYERLVKESVNIEAMSTKTKEDRAAKVDAETQLRGALGDLAKQISADAKGSDKELAKQLRNIYGGKLINKETGESTAGYVRGGAHPKSTVSTYIPGKADTSLATDAKNVLSMAESIKGGKTLADVVAAINGDTGNESYSRKDLKVDKNGYLSLDQQARNRLKIANKPEKGDEFFYEGVTYVFTGGNNGRYVVKDYGTNKKVKKALGGRFSAGQQLVLNDRISPLGSQIEGIKFDRSGVVYPNASTMPRYDVSNSGYNISGGMQSVASGPQTIYITVNPSQGMDEKALANMVISKIKTASANVKSKTGEAIIIGGRA